MTVERFKAEQFRNGRIEGRLEGKIEDSLTAVREFNLQPELVAEKFGIPLELLKEKLEEKACAENT